MDTFFFIRLGAQYWGPYLSFNDASIVMMEHLPEIVSRVGDGNGRPLKKYASEIVERVLADNCWVDVTVRAKDIRVLEVE
jgi:hypothetical protein